MNDWVLLGTVSAVAAPVFWWSWRHRFACDCGFMCGSELDIELHQLLSGCYTSDKVLADEVSGRESTGF